MFLFLPSFIYFLTDFDGTNKELGKYDWTPSYTGDKFTPKANLVELCTGEYQDKCSHRLLLADDLKSWRKGLYIFSE